MKKSSSHMTLQSIIKNHSQAPAIVSATEQINWRALAARIAAKRLGIERQGLRPGDSCAIIAPTSIDYVETLFAMWSLGVIAVPLDGRLPAGQMARLLGSIRCDHLISESTAEMDASIRRLTFREIEKRAKNSGLPFRLSTDATIIFTSGSTGMGKACLHTFGNHYFSALGSNLNIRLRPGDAWLLALPLYHVSGIAILFRCLLSGGAIMIPPAGVTLADVLRRLTPTHLSLVATQLQQLLADEIAVAKLRSLKAILLGGSAMPAKLIERAFELGLPIHTSYGSTEMASQITTTRPAAALQELQTSGAILKYREIRITPEGDILARGDTLCRGYVAGSAVRSITDGDGWYHTRDIGRMAASGCLTIVGRTDHMFISGGENIYPEEIERALERLDGVSRAVVVPIDDDKYGQRPIAFIRPQPGYTIDAIGFDALRAELPGYKIPLRFFLWQGEDDAKPNRGRFQQLARTLLRQSQS